MIAFNLAELRVIKCVFGTGLACLGLDVKVDKEQSREEGSEKNSQVSTELNFHGKSGGGKGVNDGVHCESRGSKSGDRDSGGSLDEGGLGDCCENRKIKTTSCC